jgi:hypothetical protein
VARKKWADPLKQAATRPGANRFDDAWLSEAAPADVFGLKWHTLDRLSTSEGGSAGVMFCRCESGGRPSPSHSAATSC